MVINFKNNIYNVSDEFTTSQMLKYGGVEIKEVEPKETPKEVKKPKK